MVKEGTVEHNQDELEVSFITTDYSHDVQVLYTGILPDLFREGQGIVAEGMLTSAGVFQASRVLAKHDENYMSAEVRSALESAGVDSDGMSSGAY